MKFLEEISSKWIAKVRQAGAGTLFVVVLLLGLDYYRVFHLSRIPIPNLSLYLWVYLGLNAGVASIMHYVREGRKALPLCPSCNKPLQTINEYKCKKCGKIKFARSKK